MKTFSSLLVFVTGRPLAPMTNDKLDLQECLEHGRVAKVTPSVWTRVRLLAVMGCRSLTGLRLIECV